MALVDTQGFVMAVDRSLFGPQGRRWIERKLPDVATNIAFVVVASFGACVLVFYMCQDYRDSGYWAILQTPKHIINGIVIHLVARALRWHINRMLGGSFVVTDEALPDFFGASTHGGDQSASRGSMGAILWPWQSAQSKDRTGSAESVTERESWWDRGDGSGADVSRSGRSQSRTKEGKIKSRTATTTTTTATEVQYDADAVGEVPGGIDGAGKKPGSGDADGGKDGHHHHHHNEGHTSFPGLFGACGGGHHSASPSTSSSPSPPHSPKALTRPLSADRRGRQEHRRRHSYLTSDAGGVDAGGVKGDWGAVAEAAASSRGGAMSDDGAAGGLGAGVRGSRRRLRALTGTSPSTAGDEAAGASDASTGGDGGGGGGSGGKSGGGWRPISKLHRALGTGGSRRRKARPSSGTGTSGNEQRPPSKPKMNFFTSDDIDELLHSTFFIKMCDDASWLFVEEHPYQPELNWLLSLWGGYKIAPRFPGEVKQNEAHRMLFQCEKGRHKGCVRIRSRATNTFLYFLGIKQPLTWVAWDRDVVGGDWEDLNLDWVGKPDGPDGVLHGDERGRVVLHSRPMNAYVSWNGSRFTHVPAKEGATVFMLQRMASRPPAARRGGRRNSSGDQGEEGSY